jgi:signal transduction histidine kinase
VREARRVIVDLRPPTLDDFGLAAALRLKVEALRVDGWRIRYDETLGEERLPTDLETALYRVVQEALTNVRKHALTRNVLITLRRQENNVRLDVRDEGCGFDRHEASERVDLGEHVGLSSMQERIALLGGKCWIYSRPGAGTSLAAEVPLLGSGEVGDEHEC